MPASHYYSRSRPSPPPADSLPTIGTIRSANDLGYKGWRKYIYARCELCSGLRWAECVVSHKRPRSRYCRDCAAKIGALGVDGAREYLAGKLSVSTKVCSKCGKELPIASFRLKPPTRMSKSPATPSHMFFSYCKDCERILHRQYYRTHDVKKYNPELRARRRTEIREFIRLLKQLPCTDCGQRYPFYMMHFDHRDRSKKSFNVTSGNESWLSLIRELSKCDLVCANCHVQREWLRGSYCNGEHYPSRIVDTFKDVSGLVDSDISDWVNLFHNPGAEVQWINRERASEIVSLIKRIASGGRM